MALLAGLSPSSHTSDIQEHQGQAADSTGYMALPKREAQ